MTQDPSDITNARLLDQICSEFEEAWSADSENDFESCLAKVDSLQRDQLLRMLLEVDVELKLKANHPIKLADYERFEQTAVEHVEGFLESLQRTRSIKSASTDGFETRRRSKRNLVDAERSSATGQANRIGPYELVEQLGAGGMGVVYRATKQDSPYDYALKMLLVGRQASLQELARFRIEAEAYACLQHECIINIRDVGLSDGCPFIVTDYAANGSLDKYASSERLSTRERSFDHSPSRRCVVFGPFKRNATSRPQTSEHFDHEGWHTKDYRFWSR